MVKNIFTLCSFLFLTSCFGAQSFCEMITPGKCGASRGNIFGSQHYKYKCEKPGQCCEIDKDCKEEDEEKKTKEIVKPS